MKYDFIVIGAGIAGSYFVDLASEYSSVLLLEKRDFERISACGGIFPSHNYQFFEKDQSLPLSDTNLFPADLNEIVYSGKKFDGIINGNEFGTKLGKLINLRDFNKFLNKRAENHGAELKFGVEVDSISIFSDRVEVVCRNDEKYTGDVILLATGSGNISRVTSYDKYGKEKAFRLQKSIGFDTPELSFGILTKFTGDPDQIQKNVPHEYIYHFNRKISSTGPLYTVRWPDHIDFGILHENPEMAVERLKAVLQRYKRIQSYFEGMKPIEFPDVPKFDGISFFKVGVSKHAIKKRVKNRAIVLGEAAGLVTDLFYEGICGGVASAKIASDVLKKLIEQQTENKYSDLPMRMGEIDEILDKTLVNTYLRSGHGSEILFLTSGEPGQTLFDTFAKLLSENRDLRRRVYEALVLKDLSKYNFENDKYTGETILKSLTFAQKLLWSPIFLRAWMN